MSKKLSLMKEKVIDDTVVDRMKILNESISMHDLTYEEALTIAERIKLQVLAKYIDFRLSRAITLASRIYKKEVSRVQE